MYHISIYFDTKTENRMREYIKKVAEATGNTYMLEANVPPHITISAFESTREGELVRCLERLVKEDYTGEFATARGVETMGGAVTTVEGMTTVEAMTTVEGMFMKNGIGYGKAAGLKQGRLYWVSVGAFLPHVIFLQPVLNEYLQQLSQQVYDCVKGIGDANIRPCYQPFSWIPHSTIGKKLSAEEMQSAFEVLQGNFRVFEGSVVRIGLAKMNPYREIAGWEL